MKELSIIVPVYNVEHYLHKCIDSLVAITNIDYEILLIDDGSTDNSGCICDEYAVNYSDKVKVIHKKNGGVSSARNKGLELAHGEWIYFCDADDWIDSNLFSKIKLDKNVDLISFGHYNDEMSRSYKSYNKSGIYDSEKDFLHISFFCVIFSIFKYEIIKNKNIFFSTNLKLGEDIEFIIKYIAYSRRYLVYQNCIYHYVTRENSATNSSSTQKRNIYDSLTLLENLYEWFEIKKQHPIWLRYRIDRISKNMIYSAYRSKNSFSELIVISKRFRRIRNLYLKYGYLKNIYFILASVNLSLCFPLLYIKYKK